MAKKKLARFAEMEVLPNVFQPKHEEVFRTDYPLKGKWNQEVFHNDHPIILEIGCGKGEYTVELGKLYPEKNFIGLDIKGARMWTGATGALREGLSNVAFLRTNIEIIDRFFAEGEVAEIWLTFSDPQMKKVTKRLTSTFFMTRYRRFLQDRGRIHLKTDSNFLFTYTEYMVERNGLPLEFSTRDLYHSTWAEHPDTEEARILNIRTYYEQQWLDRGLDIKYMRFLLPQAGELAEPEVEIELDEYRSYNRSKRSGLSTAK